MTQQSFWSKKRLIGVTAVAAAGALALAGCSSGGTTHTAAPKEPQSFSLAYQSVNVGPDPYKILAQEYEKTHKGVTIKLDPINLTTYGQTLNTELQAGNGPDVFLTEAGSGQTQSSVTLAKAGLLKEIVGKNVAATVDAQTKPLVSIGSKQYAVPMFNTPTAIVYNPTAAAAAGAEVKSNLEDTIASCKNAPAGKSLFVLAGSVSFNTGILAQIIAATDVYGPDPTWNAKRAAGSVTFAGSKGWQQTLQTIVDLDKGGCFQAGAAGAGFPAITDGLAQQTSFGGFFPGGGAAQTEAADPGVHLTVVAFPAPKGKKAWIISGPSDSLSINAKTKSPLLATDFLNWLVSPAQSAEFAKYSGELPIVGASSYKLSKEYAPIKPYLDAGRTVDYPANTWPNGQVYDALGTGVTGILTGQATVKQVLQNMDAAWGN